MRCPVLAPQGQNDNVLGNGQSEKQQQISLFFLGVFLHCFCESSNI